REKIEQYNLIHNFEKVDTAEEFKGTWRDLDGSDELGMHKDALDEVRMDQVARVDDPVHSIFQMDLRFGSDAPEMGAAQADERYLHYDEWDHRARAYRKEHCRVLPLQEKEKAIGYGDAVTRKHNAVLARLRR